MIVLDALGSLETYAISAQTGFVPEVDPLASLPDSFHVWDDVVGDLRPLIRSRRLRDAVQSLPSLDVAQISDGAMAERALLVLTMLANAWVWGGEEPASFVPRQIAVPLVQLATRMQRPPLVHYASMTLNNWRRIDPSGPIATDNLTPLATFLGGVDEDWFLVASIGVELAGAPMLRDLHAAVQASRTADDAALATTLERLAVAMADVTLALERVYEWCDPAVFYLRVRPYLTGWQDPGMIYEGVSDRPMSYVGGSAGQSSLIQALDAALRVAHSPPAAQNYLARLRGYMPPLHRQFLTDIEVVSRIASRAQSGTGSLRDAYNAVINRLDGFRLSHLGISRDYIEKPAGMVAGTLGTGGTQMGEFLDSLRRSTSDMRLE